MMTEFDTGRPILLPASAAAMPSGRVDCVGDDEIPLQSHLAAPNSDAEGFLDRPDQHAVKVDPGVGTPPAFAPSAVRVDEGTTVGWRRVSDAHAETPLTVADFRSGIQDGGIETEDEFDETGEYLSEFQLHRQAGQRGAVVVG